MIPPSALGRSDPGGCRGPGLRAIEKLGCTRWDSLRDSCQRLKGLALKLVTNEHTHPAGLMIALLRAMGLQLAVRPLPRKRGA